MDVTTERTRSREDIARLGDEIYYQRIMPTLDPKYLGKFCAISVDSGDYEIDRNDSLAIDHLLEREPGASVWLVRLGDSSAYRFRTPR